MPNTAPHSSIDLQEVFTRNEAARQMVAGFAAATPALDEMWRYVDSALDDVPALAAVITRLSAELVATRLDRANLLAAMRTALAAHADGEADPLAYLREELDVPQALSEARRRRP